MSDERTPAPATAVTARTALELERLNALTEQMTATDVSQWGRLRQRAERDFCGRKDEAGLRACDLLVRWQRRKADEVARYLSSNGTSTYITSLEWERRFHDFVTERPVDAATWGWLVLREYHAEARQQYGEASARNAYRFYVAFSGLGDDGEARRIFSVPGVEIDEEPDYVKAPPRKSRLWIAP